MKKVFILLFLGVTVLLYSESNTFERIDKRGYLIVAITKSDQNPFFYVDNNGELKGFDIDIAKNMANSLGVPVKFNRDAESFNGLIPVVQSGKADIAISKLSRTLARAKTVLYSKPYVQLHQALLLNRLELAKSVSNDNELIRFIKDFRGKLGVINKSSYERYAKQAFPNATIVGFDDWIQVVDAVFTGEIIAGYRDDLEIKKIIKSRNDAALKVKTVVLKDTTDNIAMAIKQDEIAFQQWVNIFIDEEYPDKFSAEFVLENYLEDK